jgi:hypothetical protein
LLLNLIERITLKLSVDEEKWWDSRFGIDAVKRAINELISDLASIINPTEPQPGMMTKLQTRYGPDEKPETIGKILAHAAFVENAQEQLRRIFEKTG